MREEDGKQDAKHRTVTKNDRAIRAYGERRCNHLGTSTSVCYQLAFSGNYGSSYHVKSIEHTSVTCPVTFAQPVIQLASGDQRGGASFAEK